MLLLCALIVGSSSAWAADIVIEKTMNDIVSANNYTVSSGNDATCYTSFSLDSKITISTSGEANCGSFWGSPTYDWRLYQNKGGDVTVTAANGYELKKIKITYNVSNSGTLKDGSTTIASASEVSVSGTAKTFTVGNTGTATNGQVRITKISVTYFATSTDPAIALNKTSLDFGEVKATETKELTFTITPSNLTANLTLTTNNGKYEVSPTSISKDATGAQTITVTAKPTSVNDNMGGKVIISGDDFDENTEVTLATTVIRKAAGLVFDPTSIELTKGEAFTSPTFTKPEGIAYSNITFTTSYAEVATISDEGVISLGGSTGFALIKATFAQTDVFEADEATCTITVKPAGVTPEPSATGYYVKVTSTNDLSDGNYLIVYEDGNVALDGNLTSSSVDVSGNTISVKFNEEYIEETTATSAAEFVLSGIDADNDNVIEGYSIQSKSNEYYLTHTGTKNTLNTSEEAVANTIEFTDDGDAKIQVGSYNIRYNASSDQERFRYYTTAANVQLYKYVAGATPQTIDVYVSEAGMATYASNFDLDYTDVTGLKAYIAKEDGDKIVYEQVNKVPAGEGVLLRATDGGGKNYVVPTTTEDTDDMTDNKFVRGNDAAVASTAEGGKYNYILNVVNNQIGFYRAAGNKVAKNRAYLQTSINAGGGSGARILIEFDEEGNTTGVADINRETLTNNGSFYNLNGQRVAQPTKGLYIVNGRKFVVK